MLLFKSTLIAVLPLFVLSSSSFSNSNRVYRNHGRTTSSSTTVTSSTSSSAAFQAQVAKIQNGIDALVQAINTEIQMAVASFAKKSFPSVSGYIQIQYTSGTEADQSAFYYLPFAPPNSPFPISVSNPEVGKFQINSTTASCKGVPSTFNLGSPQSKSFYYGAYNQDGSSDLTSQAELDFTIPSSSITKYSSNEYDQTLIWSLKCPLPPAKISAALSVSWGSSGIKYILCGISGGNNVQDSSSAPDRLYLAVNCNSGALRGIPVVLTFIATSPNF